MGRKKSVLALVLTRLLEAVNSKLPHWDMGLAWLPILSGSITRTNSLVTS